MKVIISGIGRGVVALLATVGSVAAQQKPAPKPASAPTAPKPAPAPAQESASSESKIAYVDTQKILEQTPAYAQAESAFAKRRKEVDDELRKLKSTLDTAVADFQRQSSMLNTTQRAAKQKSLEDQQERAEQRFQDLQKDLAARQRELLEPIQRRLNMIIEDIRAAGRYAIIFDVSAPNSGIVTADRSLDLTDRVIQQMK